MGMMAFNAAGRRAAICSVLMEGVARTGGPGAVVRQYRMSRRSYCGSDMPAFARPDIEAYRLMCAGQFAAALPFAERAVAGERACVPAHGMLATILLNLGRAPQAEHVVQQALTCTAGVPDAYEGLAHVSMLLGQHERSNRLYRRVVELSPTSARAWYNLASSERSFGRLIEAETACERAIALDSTHYPSILLRSELRVQTV